MGVGDYRSGLERQWAMFFVEKLRVGGGIVPKVSPSH